MEASTCWPTSAGLNTTEIMFREQAVAWSSPSKLAQTARNEAGPNTESTRTRTWNFRSVQVCLLFDFLPMKSQSQLTNYCCLILLKSPLWAASERERNWAQQLGAERSAACGIRVNGSRAWQDHNEESIKQRETAAQRSIQTIDLVLMFTSKLMKCLQTNRSHPLSHIHHLPKEM